MTHEELNTLYKDFAIQSAKKLDGPIGKLQEQSLELFLSQAIPHRKHEDWVYTSIAKGLPENPVNAKAYTPEAGFSAPFQDIAGSIVFAGGELCPELTKLPEGIELEVSAPQQLTEELERLIVPSNNDSFEALNLLSQTQWVHLKVKKGTQHKQPLFINFCQNPHKDEISQARLTVTVEPGAELSVYEVHQDNNAEEASHSNDIVSFDLGANSTLRHVKATYLNKSSTHIGKTKASLTRDAHFETLSFSLGGKMVRHNVRLDLYEPGAHADAFGLYALQADQHTDHFIQLHHHASHTTSNQLYKGILADSSRGVFTGKVVVERQAQKVDSAQLNKNLILGDKAHADTRPQLEVYADDVKCAHGATVGQIDQDEIFYLQSRGLEYEAAQFLLCHAFGAETLQKVKHPQLLAELTERLEKDFESTVLEENRG